MWLHNVYFLSVSRCDGKSHCVVPVRSSLFPDACPGTLKYLEIHYACRPKDGQASSKPSKPSRTNLPPWLAQKEPSIKDNLVSNDKKNQVATLKPATSTLKSVQKVETTTPEPRKPILVTERTKKTTTVPTTTTTLKTTSTTVKARDAITTEAVKTSRRKGIFPFLSCF